MVKYKAKPCEIEAFQWFSALQSSQCPEWFNLAISRGNISITYTHLLIDTSDGTLKAREGDFIIKGLKGELYPCRSDIFKTMYELIEENGG